MIRLVRVDSCPLAVENPFSNSSLCELSVSVVKFSGRVQFRRIAKIEIKIPKAIYVSNRRARVLRDPDGIREDLATNISYPVRWHDATTVAYERGVRFFLELPPGHTLTDLAAFPDARSIALSQMQIDSAVKLIRRQAEKMR
jgi:malonyl CoA-acyl carrier protein transacylase